MKLAEYFAKREKARDAVSTFRNTIPAEISELAPMTKSDLTASGLSDAETENEISRIAKLVAVKNALEAIDF